MTMPGSATRGMSPTGAAAGSHAAPPSSPSPASMQHGYAEWDLANGAHVAALSGAESPVLAIHVFVRGRSDREPAGRAGIAELLHNLLAKGTPSLNGSDGWVKYSYTDSGGNRQVVRFSVADPTGWNPNAASCSSGAFNFYTKSNSVNNAWDPMNHVETGGHPFFVVFVWGNTPVPTDA